MIVKNETVINLTRFFDVLLRELNWHNFKALLFECFLGFMNCSFHSVGCRLCIHRIKVADSHLTLQGFLKEILSKRTWRGKIIITIEIKGEKSFKPNYYIISGLSERATARLDLLKWCKISWQCTNIPLRNSPR